MKPTFRDPLFAMQCSRPLSGAYYGGADLGECLTTNERIADGDVESWYREWKATADRIYNSAEESRAQGHPVSAREAYLRASTYYRTCYVVLFGAPVDPRLVDAFDRQAEAFRKTVALFPTPVEPVEIPFEGITLPGCFYRVDESAAPRPTLISMSGYDSTVEEQYLFNAAAALRRGYNCLCFDGPGQGRPLIKQHLYMRPDWENVIRPVVDYALTRPEVDPARIVLMGISFGGYLAPRAASGEHRLAACIADPGQYDLLEALKARLPLPQKTLDRLPDVDPAVLQPIFDAILANTAQRWSFKQRALWVHGLKTLFDYVRISPQYSVAAVAGEIRCPTLVTQAENDPVAAFAERLYDALTCPKRFLRFTEAEGAGDHCENLARSLFHQRAFDWLDEVLA